MITGLLARIVCGELTAVGIMVEGIMPFPATGTPPPHVLHGFTDAHGWHPGALQGCIVAGAAIRGGIAPLGVKPGGR